MCTHPKTNWLRDYCKLPGSKKLWYKNTWPLILATRFNAERLAKEAAKRKAETAKAKQKAQEEKAKREAERLAKEEAKRQAEADRKAEAKAKRLAEDRHIALLDNKWTEINNKIHNIREEINRLSAKRAGGYAYVMVPSVPHKTHSKRFTAHEDAIRRQLNKLRYTIAKKKSILNELYKAKCATGRAEYAHTCT